MMDSYSVFYNGQEAGVLKVKTEGLYYLFYGKLDLEKNKIWRTMALCDTQRIDLGICLLEGDRYIINKKIPKKVFTGSDWRFEAVCPSDRTDTVLPAVETQPFEQLDMIEQGRLSDSDEPLIILDGDH